MRVTSRHAEFAGEDAGWRFHEGEEPSLPGTCDVSVVRQLKSIVWYDRVDRSECGENTSTWIVQGEPPCGHHFFGNVEAA